MMGHLFERCLVHVLCLVDKWLDILGMEDVSYGTICFDHFDEKDVVKSDGKVRLTRDAVPKPPVTKASAADQDSDLSASSGAQFTN